MGNKERHWSAEHRPPFVMEMRVQKDSRMRGLPYFVKKKYHDMQRNAILQQEVETSVASFYEDKIRSCLSINNSFETCLEKMIAVIRRNDVVNLRLSFESALYFNLYEANIRSCLRSMHSIEMCVQQITAEMQRNTDDYNKALNDLYEGKFHSCLRSMNDKDACIQKVTAERQKTLSHTLDPRWKH
ncbi:predicted protein [Chaetoceros tenuissimus]|uniref:Uncharacterized protein n=1 Tax=Chaetoceros tenuissimus TaxID=426638 RepID=A0AAD3CI13_9STRA|nr:predicted protein [Chaetoceros tenuissimus]